MRVPATHFCGNLMWTRTGTVYATWGLTPLSAGRSDEDLQFVADAHNALYRALTGKEVLLRGLLVWTDPVAVVARMIDGVDLHDHQPWAAECEATMDQLADLPLGSRRWTLTVPLGAGTWKRRLGAITRSAFTTLSDQLRLPSAPPSDNDIAAYQAAATELQSALPPTFQLKPITAAEQLWGLRHAQSRGAELWPSPHELSDPPADSTTPDTTQGRSAVADPLLDPGGLTDTDASRMTRLTAPISRRFVKVVTDTGVISYQSGLVLASTPPGGMATPGGEFLGRIDDIGIPLDIAIRLTVRSRHEALRRNKRGFAQLSDQVDQVEASNSFAVLSSSLQESARLLAEYNQRLSLDIKECEVEPVILLTVASATPEACDGLARNFQQHPINKDFLWARPIGAEADIFWAVQPGGHLTPQLRDYRHITTGTDFAAAAPLLTQQLGAARGTLLGLNRSSPLLSPVLVDLVGESRRNASPSIGFVAELGAGKALAVDTPIPTPAGWTAMGDLQPGDQVFDEGGRPTRVVWVSEIMLGRPCYEVEFSDGSTITADKDHLWTTLTDATRSAQAKKNHAHRRKGAPDLVQDLTTHHERFTGPGWSQHGTTLTTTQVSATLHRGIQSNHAIPVAAALHLPDADVPVDPYVLGCWLGDGSSHIAHVTSADPELMSHIESAGYRAKNLASARYTYAVGLVAQPRTEPAQQALAPVTHPCWTCEAPTVHRYAHRGYCSRRCAAAGRRAGNASVPPRPCTSCGPTLGPANNGVRCGDCRRSSTLTGRLSALNLLRNKHIPAAYLRAGLEQRQALLAGLLDTDGTVSQGGAIEFCVTNERLALDVHELACSLGYRAKLRRGHASLNRNYVSEKWTVSFTTAEPVFRLTRKAVAQQARTKAHAPIRNHLRYIVAVREVSSVPVRCIQVDTPSRLYLAGRSMIATHNSYGQKKIVGDEVDRGTRAIALDGSKTREWASFATSLGVSAAIADIEHPAVSLDPLRTLPAHQAGPVLQSFLTKLGDFSATSEAGRTLAKALKPTYLHEHGITSAGSLLRHLGTAHCTLPGATEIADRIGVFADPDMTGGLGDIVFDETLPALDLQAQMVVIGTHGVKLPTTTELTNQHLYNRLGVDKLFGQAAFLLGARYAYEICFGNPAQPALFVVDETWRVTSSTEGAAIVLEFVRDGRKAKAAIMLGSHDPTSDFGADTISSLIGYKVVMRHRDPKMAAKAVSWLGFDPQARTDLVEAVQQLSPQSPDGHVPTRRRGEALMVDAKGQFGHLQVLQPARPHRAAAAESTPPEQVTT